MSKKICVFGSREVNIYQCRDAVFNFVASTSLDSTIVEGGAYGVDKEARRAAEFYRRETSHHPPNYYKYGRKAPLVRNDEMVRISDYGFCVWNQLSKGTAYTFMKFNECNKEVKIVKVDKR